VDTEVPRAVARLRGAGLALSAAATLVAILVPASAAAAQDPGAQAAIEKTKTFDVGPVAVDGYEVEQSFMLAPNPHVDGYVTKMEVDVVDEDGTPVPISRLMLHHIVFANVFTRDRTCQSITGFDGYVNPVLASERFYAAGEERAKMDLPPGYGYGLAKDDAWGLLYMFMNHRSVDDSALIRYKVTYLERADIDAVNADANPANDVNIAPVHPYWLDAVNCHADPIYNVPGTGGPRSTDVRTYGLRLPEPGRIIAGGGHVHGGARALRLTEPECANRTIAASLPTWGLAEHPFYNVRPILHEPGPINMSAWSTETGIPVAAGQTVRLNSLYDNSRPHSRVMGISVIYVAADPSLGAAPDCGPLPADIVNVGTQEPGRAGPVPFKIPLTAIGADGQATKISAPPGKLKRRASGTEIAVRDRYFAEPNISVRKGATLRWHFSGSELHNVTLANGPVAIGSPNLNGDRDFTRKLREPGTYRLFCALHPVQMAERVVVRKR
jgi:plastocyanin